MKKIVSLIISFCLVLGLVFFTYPSCDAEALPSTADYYEEYYGYISDGFSDGMLNGFVRSVAAPFVTGLRFFTDPSFGSGTADDPYIVNQSVDNSVTSVFNYDYDDNSLSTYNYYSNEYETINNIYHSTNVNNTYGYNYYLVTEGDNYYMNYEYNSFNICISPSVPDEGVYFKVYFQLPDGSSSFNLDRKDVRGMVFNYNTVLYDRLPLDESLFGLFHLDGTNTNSVTSYMNSLNTGSLSNYVEGRFDGAAYFYNPAPTHWSQIPSVGLSYPILYLPLGSELSVSSYTVDFWIYDSFFNYTLNYEYDNVDLYYTSANPFGFNSWNSVRLYFDGSNYFYWLNGVYRGSINSYTSSCFGFFTIDDILYFSIRPNIYRGVGSTTLSMFTNTKFDEVVFHNGLYGSLGVDYEPRLQPFDFPYAYVRPEAAENTIAIQSIVPVGQVQYGGVRNLSPSLGDVFYYVGDNNVVQSVQQYFDGVWNEVNAAVYFNGFWVDITKFDLSAFMLIPDTLDTTVSFLDKILSKLDEIKASIGSGGSGGNQYEQFDPLDPKNETFPYDPNIEAPDGSGFSPLDFLLIFLYLVMALLIIVKVFNLFLGFVSYLFTLISIPASTLLFETSEKFSYLDENGLSRNYIQDVFGVLKGEVHFGLEEPLYAINIGDVQITLFTFMVMLFQMVIIGAILWFMHTKTASIDVPKWRN